MGRDHTDTWLFFGDSITLGVADTEVPGGYVSRLALLGAARGLYDMPPATFYNLGARRQTIPDVEARFEAEWRARLMPGIRSRLAFCAGTVDVKGGASPEEAALRLASLLARAKGVAPCLFVCPPPVADEAGNAALLAFSRLAGGVCRSAGVPCCDLFGRLLGADFPKLLADTVHPGPEGNALFASLLLEQPEIVDFLTFPAKA